MNTELSSTFKLFFYQLLTWKTVFLDIWFTFLFPSNLLIMLLHLFCFVCCFSEVTSFMCVPPSLNFLAHFPLYKALGRKMKFRCSLQHNPHQGCELWMILFDVLIRTVFWENRDNWDVGGHRHPHTFCLPEHYGFTSTSKEGIRPAHPMITVLFHRFKDAPVPHM